MRLLGHSTRLLENSIPATIEVENNEVDNRSDGKVIRNFAKLNNLSIYLNFLLSYSPQS